MRRGQTEGAWEEESQWGWEFENNRAEIVFDTADGKYYVEGRIQASKKPGVYHLVALLPDAKKTERFTGGVNKSGYLVFRADKVVENRPAEISFRQVARGKRMVMLLQRRVGDTDQYARIAEIGYTRKGSGFAKRSTADLCVVTGGVANSAIEYKGKKYPICCTGCRDAFRDDPEGVLAEHRKRMEAEKKKQEKS